jgi:ribonuclease P protein component
MTPPEGQGPDENVQPPANPPAVLLLVLAKRADFLRAASARRHGTAGFLLQARARGDDNPQLRIGYTASKKIGNAVLRNRAKRRLRALVRDILPGLGQPGWDYVLVARPEATVTRPFADLQTDLVTALRAVHKARP